MPRSPRVRRRFRPEGPAGCPRGFFKSPPDSGGSGRKSPQKNQNFLYKLTCSLSKCPVSVAFSKGILIKINQKLTCCSRKVFSDLAEKKKKNNPSYVVQTRKFICIFIILIFFMGLNIIILGPVIHIYILLMDMAIFVFSLKFIQLSKFYDSCRELHGL